MILRELGRQVKLPSDTAAGASEQSRVPGEVAGQFCLQVGILFQAWPLTGQDAGLCVVLSQGDSLCSPGWPQICNLPASASQELGLQMYPSKLF